MFATVRPVLVAAALAAMALPASAQQHDHGAHMSAENQDFVTGAPAKPTATWTLSAGGRIYDRWWDSLGRDKPTTANPAYPKTGSATGADTWRCAECHGWDYKGDAGIKGIRGAEGRDPAAIAKLLRAAPHNYTPEMIKDDELQRVALFVSRGQHRIEKFVRPDGKSRGNAARGVVVFQTVCAACHGFDGKALNFGTQAEPAYLGTEANKAPLEVFHRIRNATPGAAMINMRAFPLSEIADILAYIQTLPVK